MMISYLHEVAYRACQQAAVSEGLRLVTAVPATAAMKKAA